MDVHARYRQLVAGQPAEYAASELLPVRLARAAAQLLDPVGGVGISVVTPGGLRVPIGASDPDAAVAERLQFTFGEGPCLQAADTGRPVFATPDLFATSWPLLYQELITRSPYRAVISQPLLHQSVPFGSIDLNLRADQPLTDGLRSDSATVAGDIAAFLTTPFGGPDGDEESPVAAADPAWLDNAPAQSRQQVWIAVGMLTVHLDLKPTDALAELRAAAYAQDRDLDQYSDDLVNRRTPLPDREP